ncbi:MAG: glutamate racemase [Ignavibacteriales bacterium]|nr:glutamate racemase [Ignavibacteriales bacterium]
MKTLEKYKPIGVFDSGIGGLTVVKKLASCLPNESIVYFGDTARVPYGSKSNFTVIEYSMEDARFLINKDVKLIVVACNTASSIALSALQNNFDIPIIGMIEAGSRRALEKTRSGKIGIIGTSATINSKAYSKEILKIDNKIKVFEKACPLFVPLTEEGWLDHKATYLIAEEYLKELRELNIDTLVLGCTHYPVLIRVVKEIIGNDVELIDSGSAASYVVEKYLQEKNLKNDTKNEGTYEYYVSDISPNFKEIAERFLDRKIDELKKIDLDILTKLK